MPTFRRPRRSRRPLVRTTHRLPGRPARVGTQPVVAAPPR